MESMIDLVYKLFNAEEIVMDMCTGTSANENARSQRSENRSLSGFEKNTTGFRDALPSLVDIYTKLVLSPDSNKAGSRNRLK